MTNIEINTLEMLRRRGNLAHKAQIAHEEGCSLCKSGYLCPKERALAKTRDGFWADARELQDKLGV